MNNTEGIAPYQSCSICVNLSDEEYAFQKYGWSENDTSLPEAADHLTVVRDFRPYGSRKLQLQQCPECNTYYLYKTDYEFLMNGSEDEAFLTRLTQTKAATYLQRPTPE